ncbi:MAG: hypothetical protein NTX15_02585, partial [Candidatus Kapabacteria bacterium]|nr:hypothetical protein [Candidatus Kapabacteria bacterium]
MKAGIDVDGKHEDVSYRAQASWMHQSLTTSTLRTVSDDVLRGALRVEQQWTNTDVGAMVDMRMQSYANNAYPFVEAGAFARWVSNVVRVTGGV